MTTIPQHCRKCGNKLVVTQVSASETQISRYSFDGVTYYEQLDYSFDPDTGAKNYAELIRCPLWKKVFWGSSHDKIVVYKDDLYYQ